MTAGKDDKQEAAAQQSLQALREQIDALDSKIQLLLNDRAQVVLNVGKIKRAAKLVKAAYYRPEREVRMLRSIMRRNQGPLPDEAMGRLFQEIISACFALEQPMTVAYLGPEGTFTHAAALRQFGQGVQCQPGITIDAVFRDVESGAADYGVTPVENSTEGMVNHTLDCLVRSPLKICGEVTLRIHQHLLVQKGVDASSIQRIYSHQQGLAQCRGWLDTHCPNALRLQTSSTAEAARKVQSEPDAAAIASDTAIAHYELQPLATCIEDRPDNKTRFLVIGTQAVAPSGQDKTSILVYAKNEPGALYQLLAPFQTHQINITRIETRPAPGRTDWSYVFFMDFDGHQQDAVVQQLLAEIKECALELRNLGSYPKEIHAAAGERS